LRQNMVYA